MVDIATITAAIAAAASGVDLFDKIADQIERFITKRPTPAVPKEHRMKIARDGDAIVAREHGQLTQTITAKDLEKLPEQVLRHVKVYEAAMENHYTIWSKVYPQLALIDGVVQKAKVEAQLDAIIRDMKTDLNGILSFLQTCGLYLDDHYMHIRDLVDQH